MRHRLRTPLALLMQQSVRLQGVQRLCPLQYSGVPSLRHGEAKVDACAEGCASYERGRASHTEGQATGANTEGQDISSIVANNA